MANMTDRKMAKGVKNENLILYNGKSLLTDIYENSPVSFDKKNLMTGI